MFENQEKGFVIDLVDCVTANCLTLSFVQCPHSLVSGKVLSSAHMTSTSAFDSFDPILILSHHNSSLSSSLLLCILTPISFFSLLNPHQVHSINSTIELSFFFFVISFSYLLNQTPFCFACEFCAKILIFYGFTIPSSINLFFLGS